MLQFEQYLEEFNSTLSFQSFLINLVVTALLALILRWFYARFGSSISNRHAFAQNFVPLALTTFVIISVIKSSLALSLGLVGALSIVRFRAAIKDPEELTYIFLTIAIGLVTGADKPLFATVAIASILPLIYLNSRGRKRPVKRQNEMFLNVRTQKTDLPAITKILTDQLPHVELRRMDQDQDFMNLSYVCQINALEELDQVRTALMSFSEGTTLSFVDKPSLAG
ncbi:MAG: DUF4956 domain-containing protein [Saprospiraceae bacterium]|nr:DUF4956 domain-containing protein [Saprospiraceae bacterium]